MAPIAFVCWGGRLAPPPRKGGGGGGIHGLSPLLRKGGQCWQPLHHLRRNHSGGTRIRPWPRIPRAGLPRNPILLPLRRGVASPLGSGTARCRIGPCRARRRDSPGGRRPHGNRSGPDPTPGRPGGRHHATQQPPSQHSWCSACENPGFSGPRQIPSFVFIKLSFFRRLSSWSNSKNHLLTPLSLLPLPPLLSLSLPFSFSLPP